MSLFQYQRDVLDDFYKIVDIHNQVVLEVGGTEVHTVPLDLIKNGANKVVSVSTNKSFSTREVGTNIAAINTNAAVLSFEENTFDSVISIATLEHISNLSQVIDELHRVVKPGGIVYMHGGPLWSSRMGSHYNFVVDDVWYHYNKNRILQDWEHLYSNEDEMRDRLTGLYSTTVVNKLIHEVYYSSFVNRKFHTEIVDCFFKSHFAIKNVDLRKWWSSTDMPWDTTLKVKKFNPAFTEGVDELHITLVK